MTEQNNNDQGNNKVAILAGAAPGFGASLVQALAGSGYSVAGLARSADHSAALSEHATQQGGIYHHYKCDATDPKQLKTTIATITQDQGVPSVLIYNPMKLVVTPFLDLAPEDFEASWRAVTFGAMACAQAVLPYMIEARAGTIIFTGATAAIKANPRFAAFASAKFALRGLSQSLAREFGPQGIHIVHTILDGLIWSQQTQERFNTAREKCLDPDAIAKSYLHLIHQDTSAWTHELDMRPFDEKF